MQAERPLRPAARRPPRRVPHRAGPPPVGGRAPAHLRGPPPAQHVDAAASAWPSSPSTTCAPPTTGAARRRRRCSSSSATTAAAARGLSWLLPFAQLDDLPGFRDVELGGRVALNTLQVVHRRARRIVELPCIARRRRRVGRRRRRCATSSEGKVVLVDVSGLGSTEEVLVASFLTRKVLERVVRRLPRRPRAPRAPAGRGRRARGGAAGAVRRQATASPTSSPGSPARAASSRSASAPSPSSPSCSTTSCSASSTPSSSSAWPTRRTATSCAASSKQDISALGPEIQTLMPGECLVANLEAPFAVPAKVHLWDDVVRAAAPAARAPPDGRAQRGRAGGLMKVAALGDAHLGRAYLPVTDPPTGVNQRELDFEAVVRPPPSTWPWRRSPTSSCGWATSSTTPARPTARSGWPSGRCCKIREHGVPLVVISGNHDTPRLPGTGSPYSALADTLPRGPLRHRMAYERFELPGLVVHAVPQMLTVEATLDALDEADRQPQPRHDQPAAHPPAGHPGRAPLRRHQRDRGRRRPPASPTSCCSATTTSTPRSREGIWYAGSTDTFTFADDPDEPKGIVVLDTDTGECAPRAARRPAPARHARDGRSRSGLSPAEVQDAGAGRGPASVPEGAVARLYIDGVDPEAYRLLDLEAVREAAARRRCILKLEPHVRRASHADVELPDLDVDGRPLGPLRRRPGPHRLRPRPHRATSGDEYLARAVEEAELAVQHHPALPAQLPGLRGRARAARCPPASSASTAPTAPASAYLRRVHPLRRSAASPAPAKDEVRTTGVNADCVAEVEFEHEGHLYVVRRTITGINSTVKAEACADGAQVAEGVTRRRPLRALGPRHGRRRLPGVGVRRAEAGGRLQRRRRPAERRKLVLRCSASRRSTRPATRPARTPATPASSTTQLRARAARPRRAGRGWPRPSGAAAAAGATAEAASPAAADAADGRGRRGRGRARAASTTCAGPHDELVGRGQGGARPSTTPATSARRRSSRPSWRRSPTPAGAAGRRSQPEADGLDGGGGTAAGSSRPWSPAEQALDRPARGRRARRRPTTTAPRRRAAEAEAAAARWPGRGPAPGGGGRARAGPRGGRAQSPCCRGEADCPLCGQALGDAFEQVQAHRDDEVGRGRRRGSPSSQASARPATKAATAAAAAAEAADAPSVDGGAAGPGGVGAGARPPGRGRGGAGRRPRRRWAAAADAGEAERARAPRCERPRAAAERVQPARGPARAAGAAAEQPSSRRRAARGRRRRPPRDAARQGRRRSASTATTSRRRRPRATRPGAQADGGGGRRRRHGLAAAAAPRPTSRRGHGAAGRRPRPSTRQLGRAGRATPATSAALAELLSAFRNNVVATVGPRLAAQAAELFAELTDHEYDRLEVDPETYEIQILDARPRLRHGPLLRARRPTWPTWPCGSPSASTCASSPAAPSACSCSTRCSARSTTTARSACSSPSSGCGAASARCSWSPTPPRSRSSCPSAIEVVKLPGRRATARVVAGV